VFPPWRYNVIPEFIYVLVCMSDCLLSYVHCLCYFIAVLLLSRQLRHHEQSHTRDRLRLPTGRDLQFGNLLSHVTGRLDHIHRELQSVTGRVCDLPRIELDFVLQLRKDLFHFLVAITDFFLCELGNQ